MGIAAGARVGGRYRVVRLIGRGAMGAVFEAQHEALGRRVALKTLLPRYCEDERALARFAREARAAGTIGHEGIVDALDFGFHEGAPYLVLELLEGATLAEAVALGERFSVERACRIVGEVLAALATAHAAGIVHRDLKPANVFLSRASGSDPGLTERVKLLDFGVSKVLDAAPFDPARTDEGATVGTPAYMAPEQWMGQPDVDHRADLFAAGVLLYELVTGGAPYEGATRAELFFDVARGTAEPDRPSVIAPGTPEAIDPVLLRAVHRDREKRYQSAEEMLEALRPFGATARVKPPSRRVSDVSAAELLATRDATEVPGGARRSAWGPRVVVPALALVAAITASAVVFVKRERANEGAARAASVEPVGATAVPALPSAVRLEVRGMPAGATLQIDDRVVQGPSVTVPRGAAARTLWVTHGASRTAWNVVPDRDQVLLLSSGSAVPSPTASAAPTARVARLPEARPPEARPREGTASPSARGARPIGALDPAREF